MSNRVPASGLCQSVNPMRRGAIAFATSPAGLDTDCRADEPCVLHRTGGVVGSEDGGRNTQVVQQSWDALAARDLGGMKALLAEDAHCTDVGAGG